MPDDPIESLDSALHRLLEFSDEPVADREPLPILRDDCLELVDWSGRVIVQGKRGSIPETVPPILARLGIEKDGYIRYIRRETHGFQRVLGKLDEMRDRAASLGVAFFKGQSLARQLFASPG